MSPSAAGSPGGASTRAFGLRRGEALVTWDPATSTWRDGKKEFSRSWPASGMTKGRCAFPLGDPGHRPEGSASAISFPTPSASEPDSWRYVEVVDKDGNPPAHPNQRFYDKATGRVVQKTLEHIALTWPPGQSWGTPLASNGMRSRLRDPARIADAASRLQDQVALAEGRPGGWLNPEWVEWLMGFPSGWTDPAPNATSRDADDGRLSDAVPVATPVATRVATPSAPESGDSPHHDGHRRGPETPRSPRHPEVAS